MGTLSKHGSKIKLLFKLVLLLLYFAYFGYAMYYRFGDEGSIRLLVCTILGVLILLLYTFNRLSGFKFKFSSEQRSLSKEKKIKKIKRHTGRFGNFSNLIWYLTMLAGICYSINQILVDRYCFCNLGNKFTLLLINTKSVYKYGLFVICIYRCVAGKTNNSCKI